MFSLLRNARGIDTDVGHALSPGVPAPLPCRGSVLEDRAAPLEFGDLSSHRFRRSSHRGGRDSQSGQPIEHLLSPFGKRMQHPGQRDNLPVRRRLVIDDPQRLLSRTLPTPTMLTVVIGPLEADFAQERSQVIQRPVPFELRVFLAVRADLARSAVPPFFRSERAASITRAPRA